jgi:uncharacterized protein (TIGR02271 family)
MQNEEQRGEQYARISELGDYRVSEEDPDPRGWSVVGRDGAAIGRVEDLIVDTDAMKVRYLDVAVTGAATAGGSRARIPASRVDLEPQQRTVITDLSQAELSAFLGTERGTSDTTSYEQMASSGRTDAMAGQATSTSAADMRTDASDAERITRAEEELRVGTRQVQAGEVVVGKHVETEHVTTPVQRRVEHVRIERRPVNDATGSAELREGEIRVPVMEEEVIVEKRPVVKEEIIVSREVATETEQVEADVRRERVDISGDEELVDRDYGSREFICRDPEGNIWAFGTYWPKASEPSAP